MRTHKLTVPSDASAIRGSNLVGVGFRGAHISAAIRLGRLVHPFHLSFAPPPGWTREGSLTKPSALGAWPALPERAARARQTLKKDRP